MKNMRGKRLLLRLLGGGLILVVLGTIYLFWYEPAYSGLLQNPAATHIFAHRGFGNHAPDNSLVAAQLAMKNGMEGVDVDGQLSADGELVIFHDLSVDRLTSATGRVSSKTVEELRALDLAPKYGA